ncbi:MAG: hypothetical protein AAF821_19670 [Cyanobacteria bacterium P01_D01_bin.156]
MQSSLFVSLLPCSFLATVLPLVTLAGVVQNRPRPLAPKSTRNLVALQKAFEPPGDSYPDRTSGLGSRNSKGFSPEKSLAKT